MFTSHHFQAHAAAIACAILVGLAVPFSAGAATWIENFDYPAEKNGKELKSIANPPYSNGHMYYVSGENLTYSASGYTNDPSNAGTGASGGRYPNGSTNEVTTSQAFTGSTIWLSFLLNLSDAYARTGWMGLDANTPGTNGSGVNVMAQVRDNGMALAEIRVVNPQNRLYTDPDIDISSTLLMLAKIEIDGNGLDDPVSLWVDPDLSGGESGLGSPTLSKADVDWVSDSISSIRFSTEYTTGGSPLTDNAFIDQMRVSDDADAFTQVTAIPEPATMSLLAFGAVVALVRRRK